ncbi:hypothetical protein A2619_02220 [candidate division WWE3 bacterium RIFOXYD1_FULL_39_9]|uniref:Uncharacterized protein n=1 Tax=candidate division WWE3 bacterium RIFOXYD1_FULL_39_9 TaxID=1802649 RepID=A0A1F4X3J2_UNCKA|nr:MAG: hypothetical protein A2619_02220 [candidate division WWE3 bacterium RIFOXYD1_FULL_39_9]
MDNKLAEKLLKMKSVVDKADTAKSRAEGALSAIMQDLEKRDKIKTVEQLSKLIDEKEASLKKLEVKFENGVQSLERKYSWDTIQLQG